MGLLTGRSLALVLSFPFRHAIRSQATGRSCSTWCCCNRTAQSLADRSPAHPSAASRRFVQSICNEQE
uniref:Putative secreted protein n=1 Tax=Anopheles darlingi TaxID=43151 RepID=A0A2M4DD20_ANODA